MAKNTDKPMALRLLNGVAAVLGSYLLGIIALLNLFVLTLVGTLRQADEGIYRVQHEFFESWWVVPNPSVPFVIPGGYTAMGALTVSLVVGGLIRIRWKVRNIGVIVAHIGIVVMMVGGYIEHRTSIYGAISLAEGERGHEFYDYNEFEVVVWDGKERIGVTEHLIPEEDFDDLTGGDTRVFKTASLPFEVVLSHYARHSAPREAVGVGTIDKPVRDGFFLETLPRLTEPEGEMPGVYVDLKTPSANMKSAFLHARQSKPWTVEVGDRTWCLALRRKRYDLGFDIKLEDFKKEEHPGTRMARSYSSDIVRIEDDGTQVPVHIYMNNPMRTRGLVVYQASYREPPPGQQGPTYSVLAVHRNPSDRIPWISVTIIAVGLLWTMLDRLFRFLRKEASRAARATGSSSPKASKDDARSAA